MSDVDLLERLIDAERRAAAAEAKLFLLESKIARTREKRIAAGRLGGASKAKQKLAKPSNAIAKASKALAKASNAPPPMVSSSFPAPHITTSLAPSPLPTGGACADLGAETPEKPMPKSWVAILGDDWRDITHGEPNYGKLAGALKKLVEREGVERVRPAWQTFAASGKAEFGAHWFAENFGKFAAGPVALVKSNDGLYPKMSAEEAAGLNFHIAWRDPVLAEMRHG